MKPVVIIGGGVAGVASAVHLANNGIGTVVIERNKRLGGRASSFFYSGMAEEIDYGQHVLMHCCTDTVDLLKLLKQESAVSFQHRLNIPMTDGKVESTITSFPLPGALHLLPSLLAFSFLTMRARMRVLRAGLSLLLKDPGDVPFGEWLASHAQGKREITTLWDPICVATLNAHTRDVSAHMARTVFQRGFFAQHGADIGLFTRPLSQILSSAIPYLEARQGRVLLETTAKRIITDRDRISGVQITNGEIIEADAVISAVSLPDLLPILPSQVASDPFFASFLTEINFAPIVNIHLWFDRGVMAELFIIAVDSPLQAVFDVSSIHQDTKRHHIVISQSAAQDLIDMPVASIVDEILTELGKFLPKVREASLIDSLVIKSRKATFVSTPGTEALRPDAITPIRGLFLAGDYTATGWPSTIEGAVRSGLVSAARFLERRDGAAHTSIS